MIADATFIFGIGILSLILLSWIVFHFIKSSKKDKISGPILTEYTFPEEIDPLELDIILNGKITEKGFTAMLFKLSTKGYLLAREKKYFNKPAAIYIYPLIVPVPILLILALIFQTSYLWIFFIVFALPVVFSFKIIFRFLKKRGISKDITFEMTGKPRSSDLTHNEAYFLDVLFDGGKEKYYPSYDTKSAAFSSANYQKHTSFISNLNKMQKDLSSGLYSKFWAKSEKNKISNRFWYLILVIVMYFALTKIPRFLQENNWKYMFVIFLLIMIGMQFAFFLYRKHNDNSDRKLSDEGSRIKRKYLGFKSYITVAEKYRMRDQSHDSFEKYLPYAIVLDVAQDWGMVFDELDPTLLSWYKTEDTSNKIQKIKDMSFRL